MLVTYDPYPNGERIHYWSSARVAQEVIQCRVDIPLKHLHSACAWMIPTWESFEAMSA